MPREDYYKPADIVAALSILGKYPKRRMRDARNEIARVLGRNVGTSSLAHAFSERGLGTPSSYCLDAAGIAGPAAADHVADPGGVPNRGGARHAVVAENATGAQSANTRDVSQPSGNPGQFDRAREVPEPRRESARVANPGAVAHDAQLDQNGQHEPRVKSAASARGQGGEDDNPRSNPELHAKRAPGGYHIRGASTLNDAKGNLVQQWVKTTVDAAAINAELMLDAIKTMAEPLAGSHDATPAPTHLDSDLLCVYKVPDPHLGMFGWREEVGKDYDVKIAEALHLKAIRQLAQISPPAKHALVLALGDFFHSDGNMAHTARSGNPLDTDSRFAKVLRVGVAMARSMVDCALAKHEHVTAIVEVGNHDDLSSIMLATALSLIYERDTRVTVDTSPARFHWYRFGRCLIGSTHGSETKPEQLPMIMAHDRPEDWGATEHRQFYVGHWHHEAIKEYPGVTVEYCRTLAGLDAWASGKGFRSARGMRCDIWHREHGLVSFNQIGLGQLEAA